MSTTYQWHQDPTVTLIPDGHDITTQALADDDTTAARYAEGDVLVISRAVVTGDLKNFARQVMVKTHADEMLKLAADTDRLAHWIANSDMVTDAEKTDHVHKLLNNALLILGIAKVNPPHADA